MQYVTTRWLPLTPQEDYDDPVALIQSIADLSLDLGPTNSSVWIPPFSPIHHLPSYDPMSPSYDPCASSPCNPFPTSSPFASFTFTRPKTTCSLGLEDQFTSDAAEPCTTLSPHPIPQTPPRPMSRAAALSRIPPPHSAPSLRRTKPCRFYLDPAGCKSGRWCNFKHPVGARSEDRLCNENSTLDELRAAVVRSRIAHNATNGDMSVWDDVPDVRDLDPNWGKKGEDDVHPKFRTQPCRNFLLGLCRYGDKCQFIHAPGLFPTSSPDSYPSSLPLPVDVPLNNLSSLSLPVPLSVWGPHPGIGVAAGASSPEGIRSEKPEQMSLFYRTKPCKYFAADGTCPHGADCKFIHDPKKSPPSVISDPASLQRPSWADDDRELDLEDMPSFSEMEDGVGRNEDDGDVAMQDMTNEGERRSPSMRRRDRARTRIASLNANKNAAQQSGGIFKPMWRVVGGGVMLASAELNLRDTGADDGDDAVLNYQPRDLTTPDVTPAFPGDSQADASFASHGAAAPSVDVHDYDYAVFSIDPSQYPPNELLRPPSPDAQLEITMGKMDGWSLSPATQAPRKKRVVTGADLMRGLMCASPEEDVALRPMETRRTPSPRERHKPRLTIAVPTLDHTHRRTQSYGVRGSASYTPYPHFQPRRVEQSKLAVRTDAGDDVLDWGEDGDDLECGGTSVGDVLGKCGNEVHQANAEDIRRARSTPPTPRSSQSFDVPNMPRLPAESP